MMLNPVDIAEYMKSLKGEQLVMVFRILPKDISADVFAYMDDDARKALIESIGDGEIRALISDMFLDDAVDFLEEMPANVVKRILQNADPHTREALNQLLKYPENSAGSIMTIEYCEFHAGTTARQALDEVKRTGCLLYTSIAPVAIVPRSDGTDDFQPFLEHAVEQHGNGRLVFKAIHGFLRVWHGDHGLFHALGPGAHHHAALVVERIQAAGVEVIAHAEEIVRINGAQRAARALRIQNRAQADQLRVPLAGKLVDGATMPNLVFDLLRFFVPIGS